MAAGEVTTSVPVEMNESARKLLLWTIRAVWPNAIIQITETCLNIKDDFPVNVVLGVAESIRLTLEPMNPENEKLIFGVGVFPDYLQFHHSEPGTPGANLVREIINVLKAGEDH